MVELSFSAPYLCMETGKQNGLALSTQGAPEWGEGIQHTKANMRMIDMKKHFFSTPFCSKLSLLHAQDKAFGML